MTKIIQKETGLMSIFGEIYWNFVVDYFLSVLFLLQTKPFYGNTKFQTEYHWNASPDYAPDLQCKKITKVYTSSWLTIICEFSLATHMFGSSMLTCWATNHMLSLGGKSYRCRILWVLPRPCESLWSLYCVVGFGYLIINLLCLCFGVSKIVNFTLYFILLWVYILFRFGGYLYKT